MDRKRLIFEALERHEYSPILADRIERLLDGLEDRTRLRCCNSGCFVCAQHLLAILAEIETELALGRWPLNGAPEGPRPSG